MKLFNWYGTKMPQAPGRSPIVSVNGSTTPHVVSDRDSYVAAQMQQAIAGLLSFNAAPVCPKCESTAIATEHGTQYFVPRNPDEERVEREYLSMTIGPSGSYHIGPDYLVRSCTVCKHAWAERTADAALPSPSTLER